MIFIRGPPGSGKTHLARLISDKEKALGNYRVRHLTPNHYYEKRYERLRSDYYQDNLLKKFRDELQEDRCNFYIIEIEGGSISTFKRLYQAAVVYGGLTGYLIEMMQRHDICMSYGRHERKPNEIMQIIDDIHGEPPPPNITLIDPTAIYQKNAKADLMSRLMDKSVTNRNYGVSAHIIPAFETAVVTPDLPETPSAENISDIATQLAEMLRDPDVVQLIRNSFTGLTLEENSQLMKMLESNIETCPSLKPRKVFDYRHAHQQNTNDQLFAFAARMIIDYSHFTSTKLSDFVSDIDHIAIASQKRALDARAKVLNYLTTAEKPEDTVSNPNYSRRWLVSSKVLKSNVFFTKKIRKFGKLLLAKSQKIQSFKKSIVIMEIDETISEFYNISPSPDLKMELNLNNVQEMNSIFGVRSKLSSSKDIFTLESLEKFKSFFDIFESVLFVSSNCPRLTMIALNVIEETENIYIDLKNLDDKLLNFFRKSLNLNATVIIQCDGDREKVEEIAQELIKSTNNSKVIFIINEKFKTETFPCDSFYTEVEHSLRDLSTEALQKYLEHEVNFQGVKMALRNIYAPNSIEAPLLADFFENKATHFGSSVDLSDIENLTEPKFFLANDSEEYDVDSILSNKKKFVLIVDEPGMGKTTALKVLSKRYKEQFPSHWVIFVDLKESDPSDANMLPSLKNRTDILNFLCHDLNKLNNFDSAMFQHLFNENRVVLFLDGFDEISSTYRQHIWGFIKGIKNINCNKTFISSRPELMINFQKRKECIAYKLKPLEDPEQFHSMLENINVPLSRLMLKMLEEIDKSIPKLAEKKLSLFDIFDRFVDIKIRKTFSISGEQLIDRAKSIRNFYQKIALHTMLHKISWIDTEDHSLISKCFRNSSSFSVNNIVQVDLMYSDLSGKPYFIHQAFVEFFVAEFFYERLLIEKIQPNRDHQEINAIFKLLAVMLFVEKDNIISKYFNHDQMRKLLMKQEENGVTVLMIAANQGSKDTLKNLLNIMQSILTLEELKEVLNMKDYDNQTALHYSAMNSKEGNFRNLLETFERFNHDHLGEILLKSNLKGEQLLFQLISSTDPNTSTINCIWNLMRELFTSEELRAMFIDLFHQNSNNMEEADACEMLTPILNSLFTEHELFSLMHAK